MYFSVESVTLNKEQRKWLVISFNHVRWFLMLKKMGMKVGDHCRNHFLTNICDSDIASSKFGAVSLVCKTSLLTMKI